MVIIEILVSILYVVLVIALVLIVIALAIPAGILYGLYWLLFRSWRKKSKKGNKVIIGKKDKGPKDINKIINKAIKAKKSNYDFDSEELKKEIHGLVSDSIDSKDIE